MSATEHALAHIDAHLDESLKRLFDLVRIPSVSTDPAFADDCLKAANWLSGVLGDLGFDASVRQTSGHPMVVGHLRPSGLGGDAPHVLFYGHYDVQPADPLALWQTDPFEPQIRDGRIYGRGAADDKGQLMTFLEAVRAWNAADGPPLNISVLLEGEEECGSPSLGPFLDEFGGELKADTVLVCDTNMWDEATPAITTRLRGLVLEEIFISGPNADLHSGLYGGAARNPIRILTRILGDLHDDEGRVQVEGFYDGVAELDEATKAQWAALDLDEAAFMDAIGLKAPAGESGRSVLEQIWSRPTCDVNGLIGGYTGEGSKTVIPAQASAKVSFRLVSKQDPKKIRKAFRKFAEARIPADCSVRFLSHGASPAIEIPVDDPLLEKAASALEQEFGRPAVMMGCGGSIPIVESFKTRLAMNSLLVGFGLNDDRIHSPNEKYDVSSYHHGMRGWARILGALA